MPGWPQRLRIDRRPAQHGHQPVARATGCEPGAANLAYAALVPVAKIPGKYWVTLDFFDSDTQALEEATGSADKRVGGVVRGEPSDGTAAVAFQVEAFELEDALADAEGLYQQLRADAGLPPAGPVGGTITTLTEPRFEPAVEPPTAPTPPYRRLLDKAEALRVAGEHEYATVAAQTACEIAIRDALRRQLARQSPVLLFSVEGLIARGWAMTDRRVADLWVSLTGDDPRRAAFWQSYKTHVTRRNSVVHEGTTVSSDEAAESIAVAEQVCTHVTENT